MLNTPRAIHPVLRLGLGLGVFAAFGLGCAAQEGGSAFRGDEHETSSGTGATGDTDHDTDFVTCGEDTHGKDVGAATAGDTGEPQGCPRTQGYWKNHSVYAGPEQNRIAWPIDEDTMLCGQSWFEWLHTPPRGDAWVILVHQYIAASLNQAAGVDVPQEIADVLDAAAELLDGCEIEDRQAAISASETLDAFNNGLGADSCDDGDEEDDGDDDD